MNRSILLLLLMISSPVHFSDEGLCKTRETCDYERSAASNAGAGVDGPGKGGKASHIEYEIQDLGTLGADTGRRTLTMPKDINADGQIVGYSLTSDGHQHAFLWEPGEGIRDLGTLGYERSAATCINNYGKIAGYAGDNGFSRNDPEWIEVPLHPRTRRLFIGDHDSEIRFASEVIKNRPLIPLHIDSSGDVIGYLYSRHTELFVWSAEKGMSTITIEMPEAVESLQPLGGNSRQQVVGYYVDTEGKYAFLWDRANGLTDLSPTLGSKYCEAHAINDKGQVVGRSFARSKRQDSAFMWDKTTGVRELGVLGGHRSYANGLNNSGTVVGSSDFDGTDGMDGADGARSHAFLWSTSTGMIDLNEALHESSVFLCLESALDINDAGRIIGYGRIKNGQRRGFVMSPAGTEH